MTRALNSLFRFGAVSFGLMLAAGGIQPASSYAARLLQVETGQGAAANADKLLYADFENVQNGRPVSSRNGLVQLTSYEETATRPSRFKGAEGSSPPAPEIVRLKQDDPNRAIAFDYELQSPNQYAGVTVEVHGQADKDGKRVADDVSAYRFLTMQVYATGVSSLRAEFVSRGNGIELASGYPQAAFKITPGLNTYRISLKSIVQPSWSQPRVGAKDVLRKLTAITLTASCDQCASPLKGTVIVDNIAFEK
jgi:hypothetical protein